MDTGSIISAERVGQRALLISLSDGTDVLLSLEQLLSMGMPRYRSAVEDDRVHGGNEHTRPVFSSRLLRMFQREK